MYSAGLYEALEVNVTQGVQRELFVWQDTDENGNSAGVLRWEFGLSEESLIYQDNHQIRKGTAIPEGQMHQVLSLERKAHSRGCQQLFARLGEARNKYFLPNVIKLELEEYLQRNCLDVGGLKGWSLLRVSSESGTVRTVPASKHPEPPLLLLDGDCIVRVKNFAESDVAAFSHLLPVPLPLPAAQAEEDGVKHKRSRDEPTAAASRRQRLS
eukprot:3935349-Rhodomonas_salina.1